MRKLEQFGCAAVFHNVAFFHLGIRNGSGKIMKNLIRAMTLACLVAFIGVSVYAENGGSVIPDVVYGHKDGMALTFDVFKPSVKANGAGIMFMVSGGWVSQWGPPERMMPFAKPLLDKGFTVFTVRHGSSPKYKVPECFADVKRATRFIHLHAKDYGVNPEKLGVFGYSAGGHLSLMLGTTGDKGDPAATDEVLKASSEIAAVVAFFPPVDLRAITGPNDRFPALDFDKALADSVSPLLQVSPDDPPTLLMHGSVDDLVPVAASTTINEEFKKQNVVTDIIIFDGEGHGFKTPEAREKSATALTEWFEKHLLTD